VDPGLRLCGVALFEGPTLVRAWLAKNSVKTERGPTAWNSMGDAVLSSWLKNSPRRGHQLDQLVVEVPQVYFGSRGGGNAADLIELAGVVGAVSSSVPVRNRKCFLPREWKGSVPKAVHNKRVLKRLDAEETASLEKVPKSLQHNMVDSIGLGLFYLGRMTK
jgi:hypothetical protein